MKRSVKGVIFDFNGVILDDEELHRMAIQRVLSDFEIFLSDQEYYQHLPGTLIKEVFSFIARYKNIRIPIQECVERKIKYYEEYFETGMQFFPGVKRLIASLSESGLKIAVASTSHRRFITRALTRLSALDYFAAIVSYEDITRGKPDPEVYLKALDRLSIQPEFCVAFEDSVNGVLSAKAANIKCVAITNTFCREELKQADLIISTLKGLSFDGVLKLLVKT